MRQQRPSFGIMFLPMLLSATALAFCIWTALGDGISFCVTLGCSLYNDVTVGGISMWWVGSVASGVLLLCALMRRPSLGSALAQFFLFCDLFLLALLILTSPCLNCLIIGFFFAIIFMAFRAAVKNQNKELVGRSWILLAWGILFCINIGVLARTETGPWKMFGPGDSTVNVYFSPSCSACREAVAATSGNVNVGFFPVIEEENDVHKVADMLARLEEGDNMEQALRHSQGISNTSNALSTYSVQKALLLFRMLRNKAHVLDAGSITVPFIEYQGLPNALRKPKTAPAEPKPEAPQAPTYPSTSGDDATLPIDTGIAGSCGGVNTAPCP